MKLELILCGLMSAATFAQATLYTYDISGGNTAVPDGDPVGIWQSTVVSGIPDGGINNSTIGNVEISFQISGGYNGDLYGYLVLQSADGSTTTSILLNRVGTTASNPFGSAGSGLYNVVLTGYAGGGATDIHTAIATEGQPLTGTYLADGRIVDPAMVTDQSARTAGLDVLNGHSANGTWTLFLADMTAGDQSTLVSWSLNITVIPEPVTWALIIYGGAGVFARFAQLRRRRNATAISESGYTP